MSLIQKFGWFALAVLLFAGIASCKEEEEETVTSASMTGSVVILPALYMILLYAAVALESSLRSLAQFLIFGLTGSSRVETALNSGNHVTVDYFNSNIHNLPFSFYPFTFLPLCTVWPS